MPDTGRESKEIEFFFEYEPGYKVIPSNGVWGGLTPRGELRIDFFVESFGTPKSVKNKLDESGKLGEEIDRDPPQRLVRRLQMGVLLSQRDAESLAGFIQRHLKEFKDLSEKE